jgi:hypothetical protein
MKKHYYILTLFFISTFGFVQAQQTCTADFWYSNSPGTLTVNFVDSSTFGPGFQPIYSWWFGDGTPLTYQQSPTHTYSSPGTYLVYLSVFDSLNTCFDSTSRYVTVPIQRPGNCSASFTKAKDTTTAFGVTLTNTSSTSASTAYIWDFGDGNSATGATPSHTYQNFGSYNICLTVFDSLSNCVNTFCDTVGLDSNGTLKANGFSLTVVLPTITSLDENNLDNAISLYPNPASDQVTLDLSKIDRAVNIRIFNMNGQEVLEFSRVTNRSNLVIDLKGQAKGLYFMQVDDGVNTSNKKMVIR